MFLQVLITYILLDSVYLYLMKDRYNQLVSNIQNEKMEVDLKYAMIVYLVITFSLITFVFPLINNNSNNGFYYGFLFGFVIYACFDFTNMTIFKKWSLEMSVYDSIWGSIVCGIIGHLYQLGYFNIQ